MTIYNVSFKDGSHAHTPQGNRCSCLEGTNKVESLTQLIKAQNNKMKMGIHLHLQNDRTISITPYKDKKNLLGYIFVLCALGLGLSTIARESLSLVGRSFQNLSQKLGY